MRESRPAYVGFISPRCWISIKELRRRTRSAARADRCAPDGVRSDIEGLAETIFGVFIGATVGSAIGAALPRGPGLCKGGDRLGRGLAGAGLGLLAGIGFFLVPPLEPAFIFTIPLGSVMFMSKG